MTEQMVILERKIAVFVNDQVEYFSVEPVLKAMQREASYKVDLIMDPYSGDETGVREMSAHVKEFIEARGQKVVDLAKVKKKKYDLCLAPYYREEINAKCWLKFEYGTFNIKPSLTYTNEVLLPFDAFLCNSAETERLLAAYGKTHLVENLRFVGAKPLEIKTRKKVACLIPTYNDFESPRELAALIKELQKKYYVITKAHHATAYRRAHAEQLEALRAADECYDPDTPLANLILSADVCLVNNSSAVAEAFYAGVPCAMFAKDPDCFRLGKLHTTQHDLVKLGILPHCRKVGEVNEMMARALGKEVRQRQAEFAGNVFLPKTKHPEAEYMKIIRDYLWVEGDYLELHHQHVEYQRKMIYDARVYKEMYETKEGIIIERDAEIAKLKNELEKYRRGKLYRAAAKVYKIKERKNDGKD